jgi:hypothetical protein
VQGRLLYLSMARRAHQRASARATGVEEEHGELEDFLDDFSVESDRFITSEPGRDILPPIFRGRFRIMKSEFCVRQTVALVGS